MFTRVSVAVETRAPDGATNAYVITGEERLLLDPPRAAAALTEACAAGVDHIAVTHTHPDHVGGVAAYAERHGATVWALAGRSDRFRTATGVAPDRTFCEGDAVGPATVLATPGHAPDHVAFAAETGAAVGDLARADGSVFVGGEDGDMRAYFTSMRRLIVAGFDRLYPGHGPVIDTPAARLTALLAHRRERERRVAAAVAEGARTPEAIVPLAYERSLDGVGDLARLTVEAHLEKLATEGRVRWNGERARPAG